MIWGKDDKWLGVSPLPSGMRAPGAIATVVWLGNSRDGKGGCMSSGGYGDRDCECGVDEGGLVWIFIILGFLEGWE